jgi:hypothetical protein
MPQGLRTLSVYVIAGAGYITLSVFFPRFILSWVEGAAVLMLVFFVVPYVYHRLRR